MESTSTLVNMVLILGRVLVKVLGGGQVLWAGDRSSLCNAAVGGEKTSFGGRFSRGSCVQLHPWTELGELCSQVPGIRSLGSKFHPCTDQNWREVIPTHSALSEVEVVVALEAEPKDIEVKSHASMTCPDVSWNGEIWVSYWWGTCSKQSSRGFWHEVLYSLGAGIWYSVLRLGYFCTEIFQCLI